MYQLLNLHDEQVWLHVTLVRLHVARVKLLVAQDHLLVAGALSIIAQGLCNDKWVLEMVTWAIADKNVVVIHFQ